MTWSPGPEPVRPPIQAPVAPLRPGEPPRVYGPAPLPEPGIDVLFGGFWPEKNLAPRPALVAGATALGVLAAIVLPQHNLVSIAGLIVVVGLFLVPLTFAKHRRSPYTWLVAVLAGGLATMLVLRAAEWLAILVILALVPLVFSALTGARTVLDLGIGVTLWPLSLLRGAGWTRRTVATVRRLPVGWPVLRTALLCVAALVVFGALFATGDARLVPEGGDVEADLEILRRRLKPCRWTVGATHRYDIDMEMRAQIVLFVDNPLDHLLAGPDPDGGEGRVPWGTTPYSRTPTARDAKWRLVVVTRGGVKPAPVE